MEHLRQITSAGTAGILFITSLLTIIQDLAPFSLCVVDKKNSAFITRVLRMTYKSEIVVMTRMSSKLTNLKLIACLSFVAITSLKIWPIYFPNRLILLNISSFDSNDYFRPSKSFLELHSLRQSTIGNLLELDFSDINVKCGFLFLFRFCFRFCLFICVYRTELIT